MVKNKIELTDNNPVRSRPYSLPYAMRENLKKEIIDMLSLESFENQTHHSRPQL